MGFRGSLGEFLLCITCQLQRFSYWRTAVILILADWNLTLDNKAFWYSTKFTALGWEWMLTLTLFVSKEASHIDFSWVYQLLHLSLHQLAHALSFYGSFSSYWNYLQSHFFSLFKYFTIFCSHTRSVSSHYCFPSSSPCRGSGFCYGSGKATRSGRDPN